MLQLVVAVSHGLLDVKFDVTTLCLQELFKLIQSLPNRPFRVVEEVVELDQAEFGHEVLFTTGQSSIEKFLRLLSPLLAHFSESFRVLLFDRIEETDGKVENSSLFFGVQLIDFLVDCDGFVDCLQVLVADAHVD